jgi:hypothetical protein
MPATRSLLIDIEERKRGNAVLGAANDMDKLAAEVDKTDNKFKRFTEDTRKVNLEIEKSTQKVKDLRQQIARTGDKGLFGDLRKEEANLRNFQRVLKDLKNDFFSDGGTTVTNNFGKQLSSAFSDLPVNPIAIGAIAGLVAAAAPAIGAVVAGAVVGAVGTGGLVGGVLAASHDQRVKDAFGALFDNVKEEFFGAGSSFVDPLLKSAAILDKTFRDLSLGPLFAEIAPQLQVIVQGFSDLVTKALPGLNNLFGRSSAFAEIAGKGLAYLGESLGVFLDDVSKSPGALEGLRTLFALLGEGVKALGVSIEFLSDAFHFMLRQSAAVSEFGAGVAAAFGANGLSRQLQETGRQLYGVADASDAAAGKLAYAKDVTSAVGRAFTEQEIATNKSTQALQRENDELQNTNDLISKFLGIALSVDQANLAFQRDLMDFNKTLEESGKQWNANTEAGLREREMIAGLIADAAHIRDAQIAAGVSVKDATAQYDQQISTLLNLAKQAGATEKQLVDLQGTYRIDVVVNSIIGNLGATLSKLGAAIPHFASGGMVGGAPGAPQLAVVHGGERVLTPGQQASVGQSTVINFNIPPGDGLGQAVVAYLAKFAQNTGGGNVQLAITGRTA